MAPRETLGANRFDITEEKGTAMGALAMQTPTTVPAINLNLYLPGCYNLGNSEIGVTMKAQVTINLDEELLAAINECAEKQGLTFEQFLEEAAWDRVEDVIDLEIAEKAHAERTEDTRLYTFEEVFGDDDE